jgi:hemerythrin-like metal-binding protein
MCQVMPFLEWKPEYSVDVAELDMQHKKLMQLINGLHDAMKLGAPKPAVDRILSELARYTQYHFSSEERLLKLHGYEGYEDHVRQHRELAAQVKSFVVRMDQGSLTVPLQLMQFLKSWLTGHILHSDRKYAAKLSSCIAR